MRKKLEATGITNLRQKDTTTITQPCASTYSMYGANNLTKKKMSKNMTQEQHYYANPNEYTTEILDVLFYRADKDGNPLKDKNGKTICFVSKREIEEMEGFDDIVSAGRKLCDWDLLQCERQPHWAVEGSDVNQSKVMELPHVQEVLRLQEEEFEEEQKTS